VAILYPDSGGLSIPVSQRGGGLRAGDQAAWDTLVGRYTGLVWPSPGAHGLHGLHAPIQVPAEGLVECLAREGRQRRE
jgi:hypothetical protein